MVPSVPIDRPSFYWVVSSQEEKVDMIQPVTKTRVQLPILIVSDLRVCFFLKIHRSALWCSWFRCEPIYGIKCGFVPNARQKHFTSSRKERRADLVAKVERHFANVHCDGACYLHCFQFRLKSRLVANYSRSRLLWIPFVHMQLKRRTTTAIIGTLLHHLSCRISLLLLLFETTGASHGMGVYMNIIRNYSYR